MASTPRPFCLRAIPHQVKGVGEGAEGNRRHEERWAQAI